MICGTGAKSGLSPVCALLEAAMTDQLCRQPDQRLVVAWEAVQTCCRLII